MAILIADTDVLIDFLAGQNPTADQITAELEMGTLFTTAVTRFELLSGARTAAQERRIRRLLDALPTLLSTHEPPPSRTHPDGLGAQGDGDRYGRQSYRRHCAISSGNSFHAQSPSLREGAGIAPRAVTLGSNEVNVLSPFSLPRRRIT